MNRTVYLAGIVGAGAFLLAGILVAEPSTALASLTVCGGALAAAALIDLRERRIPNRVILPAAAVCAVLAAVGGVRTVGDTAPALLLVAVLLALALVQPHALGMGDAKAALLIALALGAAATTALLLGLILAAITGLVLVAWQGHTTLHRTIPLAPFLATGALIALALT